MIRAGGRKTRSQISEHHNLLKINDFNDQIIKSIVYALAFS